MADTPNTAPTGAPIPDAQAGASAIQLDQSQLPQSIQDSTKTALDQDTSKLGPVQADSSQAAPAAAQTPQPGQQAQPGAQQPSQDQQQPQQPGKPAQQAPSQPAAPAAHPAVQKASLLHEIATTLAGGPRFTTTVNPVDGTVTRTQVPLSNRQLGMAIALEALSGSITGLAQRGPNHAAQAAAAGYQQGQQQSNEVQQAQQDQEAQAKSDFALKAQTTKNNFQMYQLTRQQSELDYDTNQKHIDTYAPIIDTARENGGVKADGVEGTSADDVAKRFNVATDLVIPEGKPVPRYDPATGKQAVDPTTGVPMWNLQFAVLDPAVAGNISPKLASRAAEMAVPGSFTMDKDGNRVPIKLPESTQLKLGLQASWANQIAAIDTAQAHIGQQLSTLPSGDKYVKELDDNLSHAYENKVSQTALSTASRLATIPIDQWQATMKTMKTPLDVMGQVMSLIPQDAMDAATKQTAQKKADAATAAAVEKEKALAPIKTAESAATDRARSQVDIGTAGAKKTAELNAEIAVRTAHGLSPLPGGAAAGAMGTENMTHPELASLAEDDKNYNTPDGTNQAFLQAMMKIDPERARTLQAYAKGMDRQSFYAAAKAYGGGFNADLHTYDPSYNVGDIDKYFQAQKELALGGKQQKTNAAFNTAVQHIAKLHDSIGVGSTLGMSGAFKNHLNNAATEQASFYANGNKPNEPEIAHNRDMYNSLNPVVATSAAKSSLEDMMDKQVANYDSMDASLPKGVKRPFFMSQQAAQDYTRITGKPVDNRLVYHPPDGSTPTYNNTGVVVAYTLPNGQHVNAFGQGANDFGQNSSATNGNGGPGAPHVIPAGAQPAMRNGVTVGYRDAQGNVTMF
jgi:hypothetical protein